MDKRLDKETLLAYIKWIGSLFGIWWLPVSVMFLIVLGTKLIWLVLIGGVATFVYFKLSGGSDSLGRAWSLFKTKISNWWDQRPQ